MKKILVLFILLLFQQGFAQVSPHPYHGTISTAGSDCSTATNCVSVTVPPETASATISVDASSWSGTVQFEGTADGTNWIAMVPTGNSSSGGSSTTSTGTWQFNLASYIKIRARASARVSGTAPIVINWSNATASNGGGGGVLPFGTGALNDVLGITQATPFTKLGPLDTGNFTYSSSTLFSPNETLSGTLKANTAIIGAGMPGDSTVTAAGLGVTWDTTNHRWKASVTTGTPSNVPTFTTTYAWANTADGTGTRSDGIVACGGGGTGGGANYCVYGNWTTVTASFDNAVSSGDEGFLYGPSTNVAGKYMVLSTAANDLTTANSRQTLGILTSAISGSANSYTAQVTSWTGTINATVAAGTAAMGTSAISSGTCATVVQETTVTAGAVANVATTDVIVYTPAADPTGVTGYAVSATGSLYIWAYPTAGHVNFKVCNNTSGSLTPSALTLNWRVAR